MLSKISNWCHKNRRNKKLITARLGWIGKITHVYNEKTLSFDTSDLIEIKFFAIEEETTISVFLNKEDTQRIYNFIQGESS